MSCRAAAAPVIKAAERACKQQAREEAAAMEAHYLDLYNSYQRLVTQFKNGQDSSPGKGRGVQQHLVEVMDELSDSAKQLIGLRARC